ncbi:HD domain-containing protein [Rhodopila sp.]|uniref:HD domain-containing protein n=1 Tax=Rhodopila sp. TaxID=2480087 RepID=UPI003D1240EC
MTIRPQRIRDQVHNLIEFGTGEFEHTLWTVIQTESFQRLRRIRQLGFSEFVFPGATHTRFAHSLGVFHIARQLMRVIKEHIENGHGQVRSHKVDVALAAALLHDVGHGMFSHAFEAIGKEFGLAMAEHEHVSALIVRQTEIAERLRPLGDSFADEVARLVGQKGPGNLYDAVVSSQFDADRLDYMQRDRLMTGVRSSGVDQTWLIANLEIHAVRTGADDSSAGSVETLVLGPKAALTAESYLLSLFHLYPNVYLHKATRGAELMFGALIRRLIRLERYGHSDKSGLSENHPIRRFVSKPDRLEHALGLDDGVLWGALLMLSEAEDKEVVLLARSLRGRALTRCIDVHQRVAAGVQRRKGESLEKHQARINLALSKAESSLTRWCKDNGASRDRVLLDRYSRSPYKRYQDSDTPLNRVLIHAGSGKLQDMAQFSSVIAAAQPFVISRAYVFRDDKEAQRVVENEVRTAIVGNRK